MTGGQLDLIDGHGLAEQAGRAATLAELAEAVMDETDRANTLRAFRDDWKAWMAFCEMAQRGGLTEVLPRRADADSLVVFARWLAEGGLMPDGRHRRGSAPETIRRRLTGVLAGWRDLGVDYPRGITQRARIWVKDYEGKLIERKQSTGRGQAEPLTVADIHRIAAHLPKDLAGARDLALVTLDFSIGGRRSELAFLDVSDITETDDGLEVHVRKSKTGARKPAVPFGEHNTTCPVLAWRRWQQQSGIITGAAFRQIDRHGNLGGRMSGEAIAAVLTRSGQRAGLEKRITGHSPRRGFATEARRKGATTEKIADQGGWQRNSAAMHGYIESVDRWTDNVLHGIGL